MTDTYPIRPISRTSTVFEEDEGQEDSGYGAVAEDKKEDEQTVGSCAGVRYPAIPKSTTIPLDIKFGIQGLGFCTLDETSFEEGGEDESSECESIRSFTGSQGTVEQKNHEWEELCRAIRYGISSKKQRFRHGCLELESFARMATNNRTTIAVVQEWQSTVMHEASGEVVDPPEQLIDEEIHIRQSVQRALMDLEGGNGRQEGSESTLVDPAVKARRRMGTVL
jgi:hypothetical protein